MAPRGVKSVQAGISLSFIGRGVGSWDFFSKYPRVNTRLSTTCLLASENISTKRASSSCPLADSVSFTPSPSLLAVGHDFPVLLIRGFSGICFKKKIKFRFSVPVDLGIFKTVRADGIHMVSNICICL